MTDAVQRLSMALADRYRIERELGQGGMATVYLAHDLRHDRDVAVKVLREDLAASLGGGRFLREIKIAAQLQHPHILPLLDSGEADGFLFFVMPFVKGQSLRERLAREGELPLSEAVRLLVEVVDALVEAHAHGVVHRDIKPDNVMLSGRHALVTDFGVAKAVSEATGRSTVTTAGVALGTPTYMSPEQAAADPHVDHRSDIYAVGVMAYEMVCGRPPFTGTTPQQVLAAHVTQAPDPPSKHRGAITPAMDQVILTCLAKRAADRFQAAADLLAALEPLATPSTGITPTATRPTAAIRRRKWWGAGVASVVVAVVAGGLLWRQRAAAPPASTALDRVRLTTSGYAASPLVSPDGQQVLYAERPCAAAVSQHCFQRLVVQDVNTGARQVLLDSVVHVGTIQWSSSGDWALINLRRSGAAPGLPIAVISHLGGTPIPLAYAASFTGRGDTVIAGALEGVRRGRVTLRRYVAPWTQAIDTLSIEAPDGARFLQGIFVSPTDRWIATIWATQDQVAVLAIVDRQGRLVSSRPYFAWLAITWNAAGTALLAPAGVPGRGDLLRIKVDPRSGALGATDTLSISANATLFGRSADGTVVAYVEATEGSKDLWTLTATGAGRVPQLARKVTSGSAINGWEISGDGATVLYTMSVAAGDRLDVQLFAAPFTEGGAHPVTPPLTDVLSINLTGDGRRVVVATKGRPAGTVFTSYDLATARVTATVQRSDSGWNLGPAGGEDVAAYTNRVAVILDGSLREVRRSTLSDSAGRILFAFGAPTGRGLGVLRVPGDFTTVIREDFNIHVPIDTLTTSGGWDQIGMLAVLQLHGITSWQWDGSMLYVGVTAADPNWAIYRLPRGGGAQERVGPIPVPDNPQLDYSRDFRRGVVLVTPVVSDIWLLRNFAPAIR